MFINRKKKHRKSDELKRLQAKEVMTAGESVERIDSKATSDGNKKTKAEQAFQKAKEERVANHKVPLLTVNNVFVAVKQSVWF